MKWIETNMDQIASMAELTYIAAGYIARIEADLQRLKGVLLDMRQVQQEAPDLPAQPAPKVPASSPATPRRPKRLSQALVCEAMATLTAQTDTVSTQALLTHLQAGDPAIALRLLSPMLTTLCRDGKIVRVSYGQYRLASVQERRPIVRFPTVQEAS